MNWDPSTWSLPVHLAVWTNVALWGGIILGFVWLTISDPTVPEDADKVVEEEQASSEEEAADEKVESAAPRHRA